MVPVESLVRQATSMPTSWHDSQYTSSGSSQRALDTLQLANLPSEAEHIASKFFRPSKGLNGHEAV